MTDQAPVEVTQSDVEARKRFYDSTDADISDDTLAKLDEAFALHRLASEQSAPVDATALRKYLRHDVDCFVTTDADATCNCGLAEALGPVETALGAGQ